MLKYENAWLKSRMLMVSDAFAGPPWVITKMMSKVFKASIARNRIATTRAGRSSGSGMCPKAWSEAGERDEHDERRPLPDVHERERVQRRLARVRPAKRREPDDGQHVVRHAERRGKHHHAHQSKGGG